MMLHTIPTERVGETLSIPSLVEGASKGVHAMKVAVILFAAAVSVGFLVAPAHALPVKSTQRVHFDAQGNIIGESIRYCNGNTQHWGQAVEGNGNYVSAFYGCSDDSVSITFGLGSSPQTRQTICTITQICSQPQPWPGSYSVGPWLPGLWSN